MRQGQRVRRSSEVVSQGVCGKSSLLIRRVNLADCSTGRSADAANCSCRVVTRNGSGGSFFARLVAPHSSLQLASFTCQFHLPVTAMLLGIRWASRMLAAVCLCHSRIGMAG
jgi:hypothetical protein